MSVLDEAIRERPIFINKENWDKIVRAKYRAESFIFDKEASRLTGLLIAECGDLIINNRQFAIPPYDVTYIEFDAPALLEAINPNVIHTGHEDKKAGFLIDGHTVYTTAFGMSNGMFAPVSYTVMPPGEDAGPDNIDFDAVLKRQRVNTGLLNADKREDLTQFFKVALTLGSSTDLTTLKQRQDIAREVSYSILTKVQTPQQITGLDELFTGGIAGDIRKMWAFLLWLNQPKHIRFVDVPRSIRLIRGKRVVYAASHTVEIHLNKDVPIRQAFELPYERESPRRHRVRGAFHHRGGDRNCSHQWPELPNEKGQWICEKCERIRWWVRDHLRGDANKGWVNKNYEVSP